MVTSETSGFLWQRMIAGLFVLGILPVLARAKVVHVAPQKLADIPAEQQVRTIGDAVRGIGPGDRIIIHGGVYRETVVVQASGTADAPIIIEPATAERVVVTGADLLTDWKREDEKDCVFSTAWPHKFIGWNRTNAHPGDDFHLLIGRCEQVFAGNYALRQVLSRDKLSRGTFFADTEARKLYVWTADNADLGRRRTRVEASVRDTMWNSKGSHIIVRGLRFRYAANRAQQGAILISGDHNTFEDCLFEYTNSIGVGVNRGSNAVLRRCVMQYNGQMGFSASHAHNLLVSHCTIRGNSTKGWDRGWEAGGNKLCLSRGVVIESSRFVENRGNGIWFDIGNEAATVRNCLIADNECAGIFYEISFGLHAHDNVIIGNGFDAEPGAWGAWGGISLSSSPGCRIERNLMVGNREGFNYREQLRTTPRIDKTAGEEAVWNHDQIVRNNVLAHNRDAQCWGWFDVRDGRHWPLDLRPAAGISPARPEQDIAGAYAAKDSRGQPLGLALPQLKLDHADNLLFAAPGQGLFNWGAAWAFNRRYHRLSEAQKELTIEQGSETADPGFASYLTRDFRVPANSAALRLKAYPQGEVPDVRLGVIEQW